MSNLTSSRTLFICVVPAVIALISVYWLRKKKKFKHSASDPQTGSAQEYEKPNLLAECNLDSADTLSDASSFASPESSEKSLRTKIFSLESTTDDVVKNDAFCNSSIPIISQPSSFKTSPPRSNDFQNLNGTNVTDLDDSMPEIGIVLYENDGVDKSERCNLLPSLKLEGKFDVDRHDLSNEVNEEESASEIFSRLMRTPNFNSDSMDPMEALEEILGFSPSSLRIVENGVSHLDDSSDNTASPARVMELEKLQTVETDSNDSHSSVLDENSLSYVSDDSDRQTTELKNKGSLLSDFESLCDELDKSCSPILPASKSHSAFTSEGDTETVIEETIAEAKAVFDFTQAPVTKTECPVKDEFDAIDQCPSSVDPVQNGPMQLPSSLGSDNTDSPSEPDSSATGQIGSFSETLASCDSSATACVVPPAKSSSPTVFPDTDSVSMGPSPALELVNGDGALDLGAEDPQIPEMDISEHLSMKSVPSLTGMENENCSESSGWEMQDSQSDGFSQSKSDENALAGSKVPENSSTQYVYEFELPQELCGRLIGKHGKHVKSIKDRSHANVYIKRHPYDPQLKIVVVEGNRSDVSEALEIIRRKYPPSRYPMVTLVKTNMISSTNVLPESLQLHLPEGASCDVILSSLVSAGHFFLQQPTHPTYPSLSTLDQCMIGCYAQVDTPPLPHPVEAGVICAAPVMSGWYRAQVVYAYENEIECELKFVDYGGFSTAPTSSLRQIRSDFMSLPFQASECYLANVRPVDPVEGWSAEATATFEELAQGQILQALLVEYATDGIPCVHLYRVQGISNMFINKELVERGLAVWVNNSHWDPH